MSNRRPGRRARGASKKRGGPAGTRRGGSTSGRPQDHFGERARAEGYPARAVYKLAEIDQRMSLLRRGHRVLDLGAAPGSWSLYASKQVGDEGRVVGIDLQEIHVAAPPNTTFVQRDMREATAEELGAADGFDVVLSDMAPSTSGMRHRDQYLSYELYCLALEMCDRLLCEGGCFVGKIFQGAEFADARAATAQRFEKVRIFKPEASRNESYEVFVAGIGKRSAAQPGAEG